MVEIRGLYCYTSSSHLNVPDIFHTLVVFRLRYSLNIFQGHEHDAGVWLFFGCIRGLRGLDFCIPCNHLGH